MKNKFLVLAVAALLSLPYAADAQKAFHHLSIGAGAGTDGARIELATTLGPYIQLRAGYGTAVGIVSYKINGVSVPIHPGDPWYGTTEVPLTLRLGMHDGHVLFNIHPGRTAFHFTIGTYLGSGSYLSGALSYLPADYNTVGINVDGYLVKARNDVLQAALYAKGVGSSAFSVKPYFGIGFGRALRVDRRMSFSIDLGAMYQGKTEVWALGESLTGRTKMVPLPADALGDLSETIAPVTRWLVVWPVLNAHFYVRLF